MTDARLIQKPLGQSDDALCYADRLASAVEDVLHHQERHLKALKELSRNLGQIEVSTYDRECAILHLDPQTLDLT